MAISAEVIFNEGLSRRDLLFARKKGSGKRQSLPSGKGLTSSSSLPQPPDRNPLHHLSRRFSSWGNSFSMSCSRCCNSETLGINFSFR